MNTNKVIIIKRRAAKFPSENSSWRFFHFTLTNKPSDPSLYKNGKETDTRDQYNGERVSHLFFRQFQDIGQLPHSRPSHVSSCVPNKCSTESCGMREGDGYFRGCLCAWRERQPMVRLYQTGGRSGGRPSLGPHPTAPFETKSTSGLLKQFDVCTTRWDRFHTKNINVFGDGISLGIAARWGYGRSARFS